MKNEKYIITVYAICKNEMKHAAKWLDSVSEADHIVILDTGSTDGTFEFFKNEPRVTRVEQKTYSPFRFDTSRNDSMALAPDDTDIFVCIDIDETFNEGWAELLRNAWDDNTERLTYEYIWAKNDDGTPALQYVFDKITSKNFHWNFPIHETISYNTDDAYQIKFVPNVVVTHNADNSKPRNYMPLIKLRYEENPTEAYSQFYLARELRFNCEFAESNKYYLEAAANDNQIIQLGSYLDLSENALSTENWDDAIKYGFKALNLNDRWYDPYINIGRAFNEMKMFTAAVNILSIGIEKCTHQNMWVSHVNQVGRIYDTYAIALYYTGKYKEALDAGERALSFEPTNPRLLKNLEFYRNAVSK